MSTKLESIILGYLTRKYKRGIPLKKKCVKCQNEILGTIHRKEDFNDYSLIIFKSLNTENKGISSFCSEPISIALEIENNHYCNKCYNYDTCNIKKCSICLDKIDNRITTKCLHSFCFNCLMNWVQEDNKNNKIFKSICPICRTNI